MLSINRYILTSIVISLLCFMVSCSYSPSSEETLGSSLSEGETSTDETITEDTTTVETTVTTETTTQTSLEPTEYKEIVQNAIDDYEVMLMSLNSIIQDFNDSSSWYDELQDCFNTSKYYLDVMNELTNNGAVPKKYQKSHDKITSCMNNYTTSITLIQQAIDFYLVDDIENGDEYMNQALNRSRVANNDWAQIRGYGIVEYTGETLEPQSSVSYQEQYVYSDEDETYTLVIPEQTTPEVTYEQYNDGYAFGEDNVFIYGDN